jgi:hypothetical protein
MRSKWAAALGLLALTACSDSDLPVRCECKPLDVGLSGCRKPWAAYNEGIRWHTNLDEAFKRARQEKKLVFYFMVVGDLDKSHC